VVYGGQFGEDLHDLAERHAMSTEALVALHLAPDYRVGMVGFVPGFSYLIGLDPKIATPRRASPRVSVPAGSIAIGGAQTAVGSLEAPSGWHQIGRTPVHAFRSDRTPPSLLAPGDRVRFRQIQEADWHALALAAYRGDTVARRLE
jgi:KipI family sensor histidine kinase inhibitor